MTNPKQEVKKPIYLVKKTRLLLMLWISIGWLFFSVIYIDNRWFWFLIVVISLGVFTYNQYSDDIKQSIFLKSKLSYIVGWITFGTFFFVLIAAFFITPWWWFGLLIVIFELGFISSFQEVTFESKLSEKEKKQINIYAISGLFLLFVFFCIPSFIANSTKNPFDHFSRNYYAVDSYNLYGEGARDREHVIPQSWLVNDDNLVNDYINVIWANMQANNTRGNLPFGNVKKNSTNAVRHNGTIVGYQDGKHFMPIDEYKGDVARIVLYMYTTYKNDGLDRNLVDVGLMKTWSKQDKVSAVERIRNNQIREDFKYSNRFVSLPWLVGFVVR